MTWTPRMDCLDSDIHNSIDALEYYITDTEQKLIAENAGENEWSKLRPYQSTLINLKYLLSIYG